MTRGGAAPREAAARARTSREAGALAPAPRDDSVRDLPARRAGGATLRASFAAAWDGVVETALRGRNMRIHLLAALLVGTLGSGAALLPAERLALLLCAVLVPAAEVANSALEHLVDLVTRETDPVARSAKDAGAGAVLVLAAGSVLVLAAVVARSWPALVEGRALLARQAAVGVLLAAVAAALLAPGRRPRAVDHVLTAVGAGLLAVLAARTVSAASTALAALSVGVSAAVASRRREPAAGSDPAT